jgi:hypothetical protein
MTASQFREGWIIEKDNLRVFPENQVNKLRIDELDKQFLYLSGLPYTCAPYIGFGDLNDTKLEKLMDLWDLDLSFDNLYQIGHNGSGDPICIEDNTGRILVFNHDADFEEMLINNSLHQLAEILLLTRETISTIIQTYDSDAVWDENKAIEIKENYKEKLRVIDPTTAEQGVFWSDFF